MHHRFYKFQSSFTLVELLVVIAIIAILASMLLPSLQTARQKAAAIRCTGRQRQIGTALHMYANENNDYLPPFGQPPSERPVTYWSGTDSKGDPYTWDLRGFFQSYFDHQLFVCPSFKGLPKYNRWGNRWADKREPGYDWYSASPDKLTNMIGYSYFASEDNWLYRANYKTSGTVYALRVSKDYPTGSHKGRINEMMVVSCFGVNGSTLYGADQGFLTGGTTDPCESFPHSQGAPKGGNVLLGDGSVHWVVANKWYAKYWRQTPYWASVPWNK